VNTLANNRRKEIGSQWLPVWNMSPRPDINKWNHTTKFKQEHNTPCPCGVKTYEKAHGCNAA